MKYKMKEFFLFKIAFDLYHLYINKKCQLRYLNLLRRMKKNIHQGQKIKVCFLVNELSKWKSQSLYELFLEDHNFFPFIGLTYADDDWTLTSQERRLKRQNLISFFENRQMKYCETIVEKESGDYASFPIDAGIIFYQQPWRLHRKQLPEYLSKKSLLCYVPYYVPNYCILEDACQQGFHYRIWKYFMLNKDWVDTLCEAFPSYLRASDIVASGHPMLDYINNVKVSKPEKKIVIYAPHWSVYSDVCDNAERYSTFQNNGIAILEYAKHHPEIDWCFKPHPSLRSELLRSQIMTEEKVDEYYEEWGKLGSVYEGDYAELFWKSSAMITDCASFLVEYPCTGNPLIHLISSKCGAIIPKPSEALFNTFYKVNNLEEMYYYFDLILCQGQDPMYATRINAVREAGLCELNASKNIIRHLYKCLNISI